MKPEEIQKDLISVLQIIARGMSDPKLAQDIATDVLEKCGIEVKIDTIKEKEEL